MHGEGARFDTLYLKGSNFYAGYSWVWYIYKQNISLSLCANLSHLRGNQIHNTCTPYQVLWGGVFLMSMPWQCACLELGSIFLFSIYNQKISKMDRASCHDLPHSMPMRMSKNRKWVLYSYFQLTSIKVSIKEQTFGRNLSFRYSGTDISKSMHWYENTK